MNEVYNELNRIKNIQTQGFSYKWGLDLKLMGMYYKREGLSLKETINKLLQDLKSCSSFNWLDVDHVSQAKENIKKGYNSKFEFKELNEVLIDTALLEFIKSNVGVKNLIASKVLFTMYIWGKILNTTIIKPFEYYNKKIFNVQSNIKGETRGNLKENYIEILLNHKLVKDLNNKNKKEKNGVKGYELMFGIKSNKDYIELKEGEEYESYLNRIMLTDRGFDKSKAVVYLDERFYREIGKDKKVKYQRIYMYPEERKIIADLKGEEYFLIDPSGELETLSGPEEYTTELCDSHNYTDDLHNPGIFFERWLKGINYCETCGVVISKGSIKCRRCQNAEKREIKNTAKLLDYKNIKEGGTWSFTASCPYCSNPIKVEEDNPNWKGYYMGVLGCRNCEKKYGITNSGGSGDIEIICADCGEIKVLSDNDPNYKRIRDREIDFLCSRCRPKYQKRASRNNTNYWEEWNEEKIKRKEKNIVVAKVDSLDYDDEMKKGSKLISEMSPEEYRAYIIEKLKG